MSHRRRRRSSEEDDRERDRSRERDRETSDSDDDREERDERRRRRDSRERERRRRDSDSDSREDRDERDDRGDRDDRDDGRRRDREERGEAARPLTDWYCKCGTLNFRRRNTCHRQNCNVTRAQATGLAAVGAGVTKRLALSGLDTRSGEESVVRALQASAPAAAQRLQGVALAATKGVCYLTYPTVADAMDAYTALLTARLQINGSKISVAYQPDTYQPQQRLSYAQADVPRMAAYSARLYATNPQEQARYLQYYTEYYTRQLSNPPTESDRVNAAAAVAQSAISQLQARATHAFTEGHLYPTPDASLYVYDESSGYYYDPATGLYYDPNTHYYYNAQTGQYLYWDAAKTTYSLANTTATPEVPAEAEPKEKKKSDEKQDKIKVAKRIAKDMERWAKTLNQKKETAKAIATRNEAAESTSKASRSADIGFSVLESRGTPAALPPSPPAADEVDDQGVVDLNKLACLLCKRQFPSRDVLDKHLKFSELHKKNLEHHMEPEERTYRDRAAERRLKFGEDEPPPTVLERLPTETYAPPPAELGADNVGNRLLQKMGWSAGRGLGRDGQGRVDPLEAKSAPRGVGLGQKRGIYTAGPGETYQDCVKKLTIARYQDLIESETNS